MNDGTDSSDRFDVVVIGGGPGGYEAALVARQLGGDVTLIETHGLGGSAVGSGVALGVCVAVGSRCVKSRSPTGMAVGAGVARVRSRATPGTVRPR